MRSVLCKRLTVLGMVVAMMISMTGCGVKKDAAKGDSESSEPSVIKVDAKEMVFSGTEIDMKDVIGRPDAYVVSDNKIYFVVTEDFNAEDKKIIYTMSLDGTDVKEFCELNGEDSGDYILSIAAGKTNDIALVSVSYNPKNEDTQYYLSRIDDSGKVSDCIDLSKILGEDSTAYIDKLYIDDSDDYIIVSDEYIVVLDKDFNKLAEIKDNSIISSAKTGDGKVVCGMICDNTGVVKELDVEGNKLDELYKFGEGVFVDYDTLINGNEDYDFFYKNEDGIFGYSVKDKCATSVLDYMESGIYRDSVYKITPIDSEKMISMGSTVDDPAFTLYRKVDKSKVKDKVEVTFGSLMGVDDSVRNAAVEFNKKSDKYKIVFKDYSDCQDYVEAQTKMNADIIAGKVPDIIDLNDFCVEDFAKKGLLEDLTPYFEKDDQVNKDDILPSVKKAMTIDGKLYYVFPRFSIESLLASKKDVGDKTGLTFKEFKELLKEKGGDTRPFYVDSKVYMLYAFLGFCTDDYIDWNTGKCRFDSEDFKSVLEIANTGTNEESEYSEDAPSEEKLCKEGTVLFQYSAALPYYIQLYEKVFNSDVTYIGYPCEDRKGSYFSFNSRMGIYAKSEVKEGAWEFLRTVMTKEYQISDDMVWLIPTNKNAFEEYMKRMTTTKAYVDDLGKEIQPFELDWETDIGDFKLGPLTEKEAQVFRDLIDNTTKISRPNVAVMDIINEEAGAYFDGQKSLDETASIIQNRVTTFVNENR